MDILSKINKNQYKAIIIATGAGMGVDSGLPDFRGNEGFWKAYPPIAEKKIDFADMANPKWFQEDPTFAWGFYGHRLNLYRETVPHKGFDLILNYIKENDLDYFVVTSNVDGQFQKAGYSPENVLEIHGTIHRNQCTSCEESWSNKEDKIEVDFKELRLTSSLPSCPGCDSIARPNILMFGDFQWNDQFNYEQKKRYSAFYYKHLPSEILVIEIGAGIAIPSIRHFSESILKDGADVIRINPSNPEGPDGVLSYKLGALDALSGIFDK